MDLDFDTYLWKTQNCASCTRHKNISYKNPLCKIEFDSVFVSIYSDMLYGYACALYIEKFTVEIVFDYTGYFFILFFLRSFYLFIFIFFANSEYVMFSMEGYRLNHVPK